MIGIIGFEHHKISCIIGVNADERINEQEIFVDLKLAVDFAKCAASDALNDTLDYTFVAKLCTEMAQSGQYHLLETYAYEVIQKLIKSFGVQGAWIRVKKLHAIESAQLTLVELKHGSIELE